MTGLGAIFLPQLPPERLRPVARAADVAGLEELWLWEDCFRESGIAAAAAVLAWTERLGVGIGLLPVPLRNAPTKLLKDLGYGDAYQYSHNGAGNFAYQEFMPDALSGTRFYDPGDNPLEAKIRERLRSWWQDKYDY